MGRMDLPDPIRDEDIWLSAHDLCVTRDCAMPGCREDAAPGGKLCRDCRSGRGQLGLRLIANSPHESQPLRLPAGSRRVYGIDLSAGELAVLRCAANGHGHKETAWRLGRTVNTIKTQRSRAFAKLGARNVEQAVAIALRSGLLE